MDVLITKNGVDTQLSALGLLVFDFDDSSPTTSITRTSVKGRNGVISAGGVFVEKQITISGMFYASDLFAYEEKKDEINALLSNVEPFYITKMVPDDDIYKFERPGESTDFSLLDVSHKAYKYRYEVYCDNEITYEFKGKSGAGILSAYSATFTTFETPFGQTVPSDETITGAIPYKGTAICSQLDWPWYLKLTATESQTGSFSVKINDREWTYESKTNVESGQVFELRGIENTMDSENINGFTNCEHFELIATEDNTNSFSTTFKGTAEIINKIEFYK
jgi:hypothetical protein